MKVVSARELRTDRLLLRKIRMDDTQALFKSGCLGDSMEQVCARVGVLVKESDEPLNFHWVLEYRGKAIG